ncbi:GH39 family glycosyl hydrolase [Nonomuraea sp. CA-141351]|uniref:GH39 family glycosyl hydrolase n=1 Tax=Nonomuraea sp. CA-141351 TaxID=3239996 RepID=UPI003D92397A
MNEITTNPLAPLARRRERTPSGRRRLRKTLAAAASVVLAGSAAIALSSPAEAATVTIRADYGSDAGSFDPAKYLNANEGGYLTHNSLNWLPESYDNFRDAGLRMVTITHLLNENFYNVVSGTAPNFSYDYSKLDRVVLPLVEKGLTPVMGLAFTPHVLGGADRDSGYSPAKPNNNTYWREIVRNMVQHYKDLGYTGWHWEVWNEPSLSQFWAGSQEDYNLMYRATAEGVKAADPTAKIGGPATHSPNTEFLASFVRYLQANPTVPLDFLSFHEYGGTFDISHAQAALQQAGLGNKPIFITEWNSTFVMNNGPGTVTDTNAGASYAARQIARAVAQPGLSKIFFFSPKEGLTPSRLFNGDLGMVTVDNHKKAAFNTFKLYNMMQPTLLSTTSSGPGTGDGAVGAITTKNATSRKVIALAWNDQPTATDLMLSVIGLPYFSRGENVKVTQYVIDATHANYYGDFAAGLQGWDVGPNENLNPVESRVISPAWSFSPTLNLPANSVVAYVLEPAPPHAAEAAQAPPVAIPFASRNLAFGKAVTASSSLEQWTWSKRALTDGLNHTFTRADAGEAVSGFASQGYPEADHTEWVQVDLGDKFALSQVKLWPRDDKDCEGYGFPVDFAIQGSVAPNGPWTDLVVEKNYNDGKPLPRPATARSFDVSGTYRHLRVYATKLQVGCAPSNDTNHYLQLTELQAYSAADVAASAAVTTADSAGSMSQATSGGGSVKVDLRTPHTISRVDLYPEKDGQDFPSDFAIQVASDASCSAWTTVTSESNLPNPGANRRTFGFSPVQARCVKVESSNPGRSSRGPSRIQFAQIKVYH